MPLDTRNVALQTAAERIDFLVRRERFATYRYGDNALSGFRALYAADEKPVTQPGPAGPALWLGHGNVNGVAFGTSLMDSEAAVGAREEAGEEVRKEVTEEEVREEVREEARPVGSIVVRDIVAQRGSQVVGFQQASDWRGPAGELLLTDVRTVRALPGPGLGRILDFDVQLRAPDAGAVTLGRTANSLLMIRAASGLFASGTGQVRNSHGDYGPEAIHGRSAAWCACVGVVQGTTVGFALMEHPANPYYPSPWICRADGILSSSPFVRREILLLSGETLRLRYRLHVYTGYVDKGWADARLMEYARER